MQWIGGNREAKDRRQNDLDSLLEKGAVSKGSQTFNPLDLRRRFVDSHPEAVVRGRSVDRPTATSGSEAAVNLREGGRKGGRKSVGEESGGDGACRERERVERAQQAPQTSRLTKSDGMLQTDRAICFLGE